MGSVSGFVSISNRAEIRDLSDKDPVWNVYVCGILPRGSQITLLTYGYVGPSLQMCRLVTASGLLRIPQESAAFGITVGHAMLSSKVDIDDMSTALSGPRAAHNQTFDATL